MSERSRTGVEVIKANTAKVTQWQPPSVRGRHESERKNDPPHGLPTAADLEAMREAAHAEGFEQGRKEGMAYGHKEGLEEGRAELRQRIEQLEQMLTVLDKPFEQLDQQVEDEIVTLVISMVRQLIRREVRLDPGQIVGVVREALGILPVSSRNIRVMLHPEDAELVRAAYTLGDHDQQWQIVEDPVIQRGGCRIHTDTSQIDATLDSRLNSLIAPLLAAERQKDNDGEAEPDA